MSDEVQVLHQQDADEGQERAVFATAGRGGAERLRPGIETGPADQVVGK